MLKSNSQMTDPSMQLSTAQKDALNSGVTSATVAQVTTNKNDIAVLKGKHIYCHCLKLGINSVGYITTMVLSADQSTEFTFSTFCKWLKDHGFDDNNTSVENNNKRYWCTGAGTSAYINMISAPSQSQLRFFYGSFMQLSGVVSSVTWFTDTVIQLL